MEPTAVVIEFYILEQGTDRLFTGAQRLIDQFAFERAPERFHGGVVIAIALAAHAPQSLTAIQQRTIFLAAVLQSPIGMMQQASTGPT